MTSMHDDEQFQKIKEWWHKHGTIVLIVIAVLALLNFGWQYSHKFRERKAEQASLIYEQLLVANLSNKSDDVAALVKQLHDDYSHTPYASLATLLLAHNDINKNDLPAAEQDLQWVINNTHSNGLKEIAKLRNARLLLETKKPNEALAMLNKIDDKTFAPMVHLIRGDVLVALGKNQDALAEYLEAKKDQNPNTPFVEIVELKISHANLH
jgi:predicted negative regulator of RcsB-dependent stress response